MPCAHPPPLLTAPLHLPPLPPLCLQATLESLRVDIQEVIVAGQHCAAANYHVVVKRRGCAPAELRLLAVFRLAGPGGQVVGMEAATRLVSGTADDAALSSIGLP